MVISINVGLDFGTSSTKAAFRIIEGATAGGNRVWPVLFPHHLTYYPNYCLPSLAAYDSGGQLLFGHEAADYLKDQSWNAGFRRFKVLLAGEQDRQFHADDAHEAFRQYLSSTGREMIEVELLTALYVAYAMRQARRVIEKQAFFRGTPHALNLIFNICMPIDHITSHRVRRTFEHAFAWAELIEREWPATTDRLQPAQIAQFRALGQYADYARAPRMTESVEQFARLKDEARVFAIPESVAQMEAYWSSLYRHQGMHAVIDIGAGTTDVSLFRLGHRADEPERRNGQLFYPKIPVMYWHAARAIPRGCAHFEQHIAQRHAQPCRPCQTQDLAQHYGGKCTRRRQCPVSGLIRRELEELHVKTTPAWRQAFKHYQRFVSRTAVRVFQGEKLKVFLSGGGSLVPGAEEIFAHSGLGVGEAAWEEPHPLRNIRMMKPRDFEDQGMVPFHRAAVAYGLATPLMNLNPFVLPQDAVPPPEPKLPFDYRTYGLEDN